MIYSKEYARMVGRNYWDVDLEDAFIDMRHRTNRARVRERVFYCEGFDITKIRITTKGEGFVHIWGRWEPYPQAIHERVEKYRGRHLDVLYTPRDGVRQLLIPVSYQLERQEYDWIILYCKLETPAWQKPEWLTTSEWSTRESLGDSKGGASDAVITWHSEIGLRHPDEQLFAVAVHQAVKNTDVRYTAWLKDAVRSIPTSASGGV